MSLLASVIGEKRIPTSEGYALGKRLFQRLISLFADSQSIRNIELTIFETLTEENAIKVHDGEVGINLLAVPAIFYFAHVEYKKDNPCEAIDDITKCLVLCCPDHTTAWNQRKTLLSQHSTEDSLKIESMLTILALKIHPKSSETYAHRRWIFWTKTEKLLREIANLQLKMCKYVQDPSHLPELQRNFNDKRNFANFQTLGAIFDSLLSMAHEEFVLCVSTGQLQKSNYNGWAHKLWVINLLKKCFLQICENSGLLSEIFTKFSEFLKTDILQMMKIAEKSVSDISIVSSLLQSLLVWTELCLLRVDSRSIPNIMTMWNEVLSHNSQRLQLYDEHETLWRHRTNIFLCFGKLTNKVNLGNIGIDTFSIETETRFCNKFISEGICLAQRHISCLNRFYG